jgi:predicted 3-demethylubiquinone-9 3-methyltransferase (glyoxalase superfamily)
MTHRGVHDLEPASSYVIRRSCDEASAFPPDHPGPRPAGMVMTVDFELEGHGITALNGGPEFSFTEALSLAVNCESQQEVDYLWMSLSEGGEEGPCGWLKDRYGLSWQIMPVRLTELLNDPDEAAAQRVMAAMLQMTKIDIAELKRAYAAGA